jgi:hypothetical protein
VGFTNTTGAPIDIVGLSGSPFGISNGGSFGGTNPNYVARQIQDNPSSCIVNVFTGLIRSLAAGASCTLAIERNFGVSGTSTAGNFDSTLTLTTSQGNTTVALKSAVGAVTYPIVVSPTSLTLTRVSIASATSIGTVTLTNPAPVAVALGAIIVPSPFSRVGGSCPTTFPASIPVGGSCTVDLLVPAGAGSSAGADSAKATTAFVAPIEASTGNVEIGLVLRTGADVPQVTAREIPTLSHLAQLLLALGLLGLVFRHTQRNRSH